MGSTHLVPYYDVLIPSVRPFTPVCSSGMVWQVAKRVWEIGKRKPGRNNIYRRSSGWILFGQSVLVENFWTFQKRTF